MNKYFLFPARRMKKLSIEESSREWAISYLRMKRSRNWSHVSLSDLSLAHSFNLSFSRQ